MRKLSDFQTRLLLAAVLAALSLAVFWPATHYDFIKLDDPYYVSDNAHVLTGLTGENIRWAFHTIYLYWWLPLLWISYMVDATLFGPGPYGFHLTNILLHAANAALLFWTLSRMTGSKGRSFFVAALFALHPLRVESVAWITERKDVLSGLFLCLCLLAYLRQVERPTPLRFWLLQVLMLLGLMAKSILIVLPFLLLLLDYWPLRRSAASLDLGVWKRWRPLLVEKSFLFGLAILFAALTIFTHPPVGAHVTNTSLWNRATLIAPNYWSYLGKIFWPTQLSILYPPTAPAGLLRLLAPLGLLGLTLLFWRRRVKCPALLVGWLWFLATLFPVIRGIRFDEQSAFSDRYTYLPAIGVAIALTWGAGEWIRTRPHLRLPLLSAGALLVIACVALTRSDLPLWTNSAPLFTRLIQFAPEHDMSNNCYGRLLLDQGKPAEALPYLAKAFRLNPADPIAPANYAEALIALERNEDAIAWLKAALEKCDAQDANLNILLACAYLNTGQAVAALPYLQIAVAGQPDRPGWRVELIRACFEAGLPESAQAEILRLRAQGVSQITDFDSLIAHYGGLWRQGERLHAWHFFQNNLARCPSDIALHRYAAWLLATDPEPPAPMAEAVRLAQQAIQLNSVPDYRLLATLAAAFAANGQFEEAQQTSGQALAMARQSGDEISALEISRHLAAYQQHRPWREGLPEGIGQQP
jgi:protein O-mannosyl-transferase